MVLERTQFGLLADTLQSMNTHTIIADRIESGTYLAMAAAVGDGVMVHNVIPEHLESFNSKMIEMGVDGKLIAIRLCTASYIQQFTLRQCRFGFVTDQKLLTPLMSLAEGAYGCRYDRSKGVKQFPNYRRWNEDRSP